MLAGGASLENGIFNESEAGLVDLDGAEVSLRYHAEAGGFQQLIELPQLAFVVAGQHDAMLVAYHCKASR